MQQNKNPLKSQRPPKAILNSQRIRTFRYIPIHYPHWHHVIHSHSKPEILGGSCHILRDAIGICLPSSPEVSGPGGVQIPPEFHLGGSWNRATAKSSILMVWSMVCYGMFHYKPSITGGHHQFLDGCSIINHLGVPKWIWKPPWWINHEIHESTPPQNKWFDDGSMIKYSIRFLPSWQMTNSDKW